jgi:hypothetical protein
MMMQTTPTKSSKQSLFEPKTCPVLLYTYDNICTSFFNGQYAANLYLETEKKSLMEKFFGRLLKYNSIVDCIVEMKKVEHEVYLQVVHGRMKSLMQTM